MFFLPLEATVGARSPLVVPGDPRVGPKAEDPDAVVAGLRDAIHHDGVFVSAVAPGITPKVLHAARFLADHDTPFELALSLSGPLDGKLFRRLKTLGLRRLFILWTGPFVVVPGERLEEILALPGDDIPTTLVIYPIDDIPEPEVIAALPDGTQLDAERLTGERLVALARTVSRLYSGRIGDPRALHVNNIPPCLFSGTLRDDYLQLRVDDRWFLTYFSAIQPPFTHPVGRSAFDLRQVAPCPPCSRAAFCPGVDPSFPVTTSEIAPLVPKAVPRRAPRFDYPAGTPSWVSAILDQENPYAVEFTLPVEQTLVSSGLKTTFRWVLPTTEVTKKATLARSWGLETLLGRHPVEESLTSNAISLGPGTKPSSQILYASTSSPILHSLRSLDERLLSGKLPPEKQHDLTDELGSLLGYPDCCRSAFESHTAEQNVIALRNALERSAAVRPELNFVQPSAISLLPWTPCRMDCPSSLQYVHTLLSLLNPSYSDQVALLLEILGLPRLIWGERSQLIRGPRAPRRVFTPVALDHRESCLNDEIALLIELNESQVGGFADDPTNLPVHPRLGAPLVLEFDPPTFPTEDLAAWPDPR